MHVRHGKRLLNSLSGKIGLCLVGLLAAAALLSPALCGDPARQTLGVLQAPSSKHLLGANDVGQDIFSRLLCGAQTSLIVAVCAGLLSTTLSAFVGMTAALIGGPYERAVMRLVDALLVIPGLVVAILIAAFIQPGLWGLIAVISLLHWAGGARVVRAQTLHLMQHEHVEAARTFGAGRLHLVLRHIVPDLGPILLVSFVHRARMAVFMEAGLAFIGIADPSMVSWGTMIQNALGFYYLPAWKWWLLPPGLCLSLLILSFVFTGHALESVMEPRLRDA